MQNTCVDSFTKNYALKERINLWPCGLNTFFFLHSFLFFSFEFSIELLIFHILIEWFHALLLEFSLAQLGGGGRQRGQFSNRKDEEENADLGQKQEIRVVVWTKYISEVVSKLVNNNNKWIQSIKHRKRLKKRGGTRGILACRHTCGRTKSSRLCFLHWSLLLFHVFFRNIIIPLISYLHK